MNTNNHPSIEDVRAMNERLEKKLEGLQNSPLTYQVFWVNGKSRSYKDRILKMGWYYFDRYKELHGPFETGFGADLAAELSRKHL